MIPTGFTVTLSTKLYFGLTTTVISEQQSNIIPEFWRNKISERVFNDVLVARENLLAFDITLGWFTCIWLYPRMICLHLTLPLDDLLAFDFILEWFTCIWHHPWMMYLHLALPLDDLLAFDYPWMIYLHLTLPLDDLFAFDFTPGWFTCIGHYPWMIYLHMTLPLDDLLEFDITLGSKTDCKADIFRIETWCT